MEVAGTEDEIEKEPEVELTKNSTIEVSIDDLNEGIIVVSYAHQDNLYQGVLLQLNRERGIPSGISFPKDFCTGNTRGVDDGENDPSQITPLNQRHTYFQDNIATAPEGNLPKSRLGLRRIIKPPARFKNSRMSLRLRARPVLCAKCKTLCEDDQSEKNSEPSKPNSRNKQKNNGNGARKGLPKVEVSDIAPNARVETQTVSVDHDDSTIDSQDYSYEVVGARDIVENYWRRPMSKPVQKPSGHIPLDSLTPPFHESIPGIRYSVPERVPIPLNPNSKSANFQHEFLQSWHSPEIDENRRSRKSQSLKFCINRLSTSSINQEDEDHLNADNFVNGTFTARSNLTTGESEMHYNYNAEDPLPENVIASRTRRRPARRLKNPETRTQSRKRSSTVPVRFRDESYLTRKDTFKFKRLRGDDSEEIDNETAVIASIATMNHDDLENTSSAVASQSSPWAMPTGSIGEVNRCSSSSSSTSMSQATTPTNNGHASVSDMKKEATSGKIPVLKITFGSPGNGIVVIPPKNYPSVNIPSDSDSTSKSVRRAIRKAKKKARRKFVFPLVSGEVEPLDPSPSVFESMLPLQVQRQGENNVTGNTEFADQNPYEDDPPSPQFELITPKKKKKGKKRKRSRPGKDESPSSTSTPVDLNSSNPVSSVTSSSQEENDTPFWRNVSLNIARNSVQGEDRESYRDQEEETNHVPTQSYTSPTSTIDEYAKEEDKSKTSGKQRDHRLFISLKRTESSDPNSYISYRNANSDAEVSDSDSVVHIGERVVNLDGSISRNSSESENTHDYPVNVSPSSQVESELTYSVDIYTDNAGTTYRKDDIIWGKLSGCPWWPAKILDILYSDADEVRAKVAWYQATTMSCVRMSMVVPFESEFDSKYKKNQKRGSYRKAVRAALIEVHQLNPDDLTSD